MRKTDRLSAFCELCKETLTANLLWDAFPHDQPLTQDLRRRGEAHLIHDHWLQSHRVCAVCGTPVTVPLSFTPNTQGFVVHPDYVEVAADGRYFTVGPGDPPYSRLLFVHEACNPEPRVR
jgi:hypothetical protein